MATTAEGYFVIAAWVIAAACLVAIIAVAIREKRRTGHWPPDVVSDASLQRELFSIGLMADFLFHGMAPGHIVASVPSGLALAGLDLSLCLALVANAALAISQSFKPGWDRQLGLRQTYFLVFAFLPIWLLVSDIRLFASIPWIWIFAAVEAAFLAPVLTRLVYVEYYRRLMEPQENSEPRASAIWRP